MRVQDKSGFFLYQIMASQCLGYCLAIKQADNAHPFKLAEVFLDLVRDHDVPIGAVVVLPSYSHLGKM